jgi:hypothetical protein
MHPDYHACIRKFRHTTNSDAQAELGRMRRTGVAEPERLRVYRCGYCGGFHLGRKPRKGPVLDERARGPPLRRVV